MAQNHEDQDIDPTISSRAPYLPPTTGRQTLDALLGPAGLASLLTHPEPTPTQGLASALGYEGPMLLQHPGLAGALLDRGITALPGSDPRLVNVTSDRSQPAFQTANGTVIHVNKPAPRKQDEEGTSLPWGEGLDHLIKFEDQMKGVPTLTGGTETYPHSSNPLDAHGNIAAGWQGPGGRRTIHQLCRYHVRGSVRSRVRVVVQSAAMQP